jgi:hypothetical protein
MDQVFTGPGKITVELTKPSAKPKPLWRELLRFMVLAFLITGGLHLLNWIAYMLQ